MDDENNGWVEVRDPYTGKLLCRFDKKKFLLEVRRGKVTTTVALRYYEDKQNDKEDSDK